MYYLVCTTKEISNETLCSDARFLGRVKLVNTN